MEKMAKLPADMIFFTQITMEAAEDPEFLKAMKLANIKGALVGIESVTPEGLKDIYKDFNLRATPWCIDYAHSVSTAFTYSGHLFLDCRAIALKRLHATASVAERAEITFAQFVMLTPFPGTVDFIKWEKEMGNNMTQIGGIPITRRWLIPHADRPKLYCPHPVMSAEEIREHTQEVWDQYYTLPAIWRRSRFLKSMKSRLAFLLISKIYRQMYADTGIASDSARASRSTRYVRWMAVPCQRLFSARPMPQLQVP